MFNLKNSQHLESPFDVVILPSGGYFYPNKKSSLFVRYLTGIEENMFTSPGIFESDYFDTMILDSVIMDKDINVNEILSGDKQAIYLYLRLTSFGDKYPLLITCPKCGQTGETSFRISDIESKDVLAQPNENGVFHFVMPKMKLDDKPVVISFKPLTVIDEQEIAKEIKLGGKINKSTSIKYRYQINAINDISDKNAIAKIISKFPIKDSSALKEYMEAVEPGINPNVNLKCKHCNQYSKEKITIDSKFLGLIPEYKSKLWEEIFLLLYYGEGGFSKTSATKLSTSERRWFLQRIIEEKEKKNKAETEASEAASRKNSIKR